MLSWSSRPRSAGSMWRRSVPHPLYHGPPTSPRVATVDTCCSNPARQGASWFPFRSFWCRHRHHLVELLPSIAVARPARLSLAVLARTVPDSRQGTGKLPPQTSCRCRPCASCAICFVSGPSSRITSSEPPAVPAAFPSPTVPRPGRLSPC